MRTIDNAYDAYHFLHDHPDFMLRERHEISEEEYVRGSADGFLVTRDKGGKCWRELRHLHRHAIEMNLSMFYAKVDETRTVNDDLSRNVNVEVWLEFGPEEYDYPAEWYEETDRMEYHDWRLDCGGPTFDAALVELANLVLKEYGDYDYEASWDARRKAECGEVSPCADCRESRRRMREMGLESKSDGEPELISGEGK
jgi:hypothetical protein